MFNDFLFTAFAWVKVSPANHLADAVVLAHRTGLEYFFQTPLKYNILIVVCGWLYSTIRKKIKLNYLHKQT